MKLENLLPAILKPTDVHKVTLPHSGEPFEIPLCRPEFSLWPDNARRPTFDFGGKTFLNFENEPVFAEILILRLLERAGWRGCWVSAYGRKYLCDMPSDFRLSNGIRLPPQQDRILQEIARRAEMPGGCFDVLAWRKNKILFCEAKRAGRDKFRPTQKKWLEAALADGKLGTENFLIVEWKA